MRRALIIFVAKVALIGSVNAQTVQILLFGSEDHKEFLGFLNCSELSKNSIWNDYFNYGWKNEFGVWNAYGKYKNPYGIHST